MSKTFGEKVKELRKQRSMTQIELAENLGVSRRVVIDWENDKYRPRTEERLNKLASVMGVNVCYFKIDEPECYLGICELEMRVSRLKEEILEYEKLIKLMKEKALN